MAALLILIQVITGILLRFYYTPTPGEAYDLIIFLKDQVLFGQFIRNIHYWSGVFMLQTFYTFHAAVLPILLVVLALYHFWRVRKAGGVLIPETGGKPEMVPVEPNLVFKEFIVALVLVALLFTFSALFNAPLLEKANPSYSMNPTKAPWYFAGLQELLMHFHPFFAAFIIPVSVMVFLAWIPFLKYDQLPNGHWFISEKGKQSSKATAIFAAVVTIAGILANEYVLNFEILLHGIPAVISNGIIPLLIILGLMAVLSRSR